MILTAFNALDVRTSLKSELMVALAEVPGSDQYGSVAESVPALLSDSLSQSLFETVQEAFTSLQGRSVATNVATVLTMGKFFDSKGSDIDTETFFKPFADSVTAFFTTPFDFNASG